MDYEGENISVKLGRNQIIQNICFKFRAGSFVIVLGPNGSGKSTLLKSIAGIIKFQGKLWVANELSNGLLNDRRPETFSYVPQNFMVPLGMRLGEYVMLGRKSHSNWFFGEKATDYDAVNRALENLNLLERYDDLVTNLSGGEMQRALLARALAQEAQLLILDEPTASLDFAKTNDFLTKLDLLRKRLKITIILSTHDINSAIKYADYALVLKKGENLYSGGLGGILNSEFLSTLYDTKLDRFLGKTGTPVFYAST